MSHGEGQEEATNTLLAHTGPRILQTSAPRHLGDFIPSWQRGRAGRDRRGPWPELGLELKTLRKG